MLGGGWQPLLCPMGGSAHGLSPEKFRFWAELEPGSCREAVGASSGRASRLLHLQAWVWASPQKSLPAETFREWVDTSKNKSSSGM